MSAVRQSVDPRLAAAMSVVLVVAGVYLVSGATGSTAFLGWLFVVVGGISVVGNLVLWWWQRH